MLFIILSHIYTAHALLIYFNLLFSTSNTLITFLPVRLLYPLVCTRCVSAIIMENCNKVVIVYLLDMVVGLFLKFVLGLCTSSDRPDLKSNNYRRPSCRISIVRLHRSEICSISMFRPYLEYSSS